MALEVGRIEYSPVYSLEGYYSESKLKMAFNGNRDALKELQEIIRELREQVSLLETEIDELRSEVREGRV